MMTEQTPEEIFQAESLKLASLAAQVINDTGRGRRHPLGAYQEVASVIVKPGAPRSVKLVGIILPIAEAEKLINPASEILKAMEDEDGKE